MILRATTKPLSRPFALSRSVGSVEADTGIVTLALKLPSASAVAGAYFVVVLDAPV